VEEITIVGLDLAKHVFQVHATKQDGTVLLRRKLPRSKVLTFFASLPKCVVAMEACASAHHWGREIGALGHEVRLIAPAYVKPFVKRQKNDAADAEAIAEAASRATMRFVPVKSAAKQGACMVFKARDLMVRQRTQTVNALRGHLAEYGVIAPQGLAHLGRLVTAMDDAKGKLPAVVIALCAMLIEHIAWAASAASAGVPGGAMTPNHSTTSRSKKPISRIVGVDGSDGPRRCTARG
jgi:transposase